MGKKNRNGVVTIIPTDNRKIVDLKDPSSLGVILFQDKDIQAITKNTGPLVNANEYQVHYHFLNGRAIFEDDSYIDIAIPTCYFNYKQEVSGSSVDFHLDDVDTASEMLKVVADTKYNELMASPIAAHIESMFSDITFEWKAVNLGTIHKHPGSLDSFSGTDLSTKIEDPGICFPLGVIEKDYYKPSFSSILLHKTGKTVVGHTEYRLAAQDAETVSYYKGRCITLVSGTQVTSSLVEQLLGVLTPDTSYIEKDNVTTVPAVVTELYKQLKELDYNASTEFIKSDNVSTKTYAPTTYTSTYANNNKNNGITSVPHFTSAAYKEVEKFLFETDGIVLYQWVDLNKMPPVKELEHLNALEQFHEDVPVTHYRYTIKTTAEITALQRLIWAQAKKDMDDEAKRQTNARLAAASDKDDEKSLLKDIDEDLGPDIDEEKIGIDGYPPVKDMEDEIMNWGITKSVVENYTLEELQDMYDTMRPYIA